MPCIYPVQGNVRPLSANSASPARQEIENTIGNMLPHNVLGTANLNPMQFLPDFWDPSIVASTNWLVDLDAYGQPFPDYGFPTGQNPLPSQLLAANNAPSGHAASSPALTNTTGTGTESVDRPAEAGAYYVDGEPARLPRVKRRRTSHTVAQQYDEGDGSFSLSGTSLDIGHEIVYLSEGSYDQLRQAYEQCCMTPSLLWDAFEQVAFPPLPVFDRLIQSYRENFDQVMPFMHWSSLKDQALHWTVVAAMSAIGSRYVDHDQSYVFARSMQEFVRRISTWLESKHGSLGMNPTDSARFTLLHAVGVTYGGDLTTGSHTLGLQHKLAYNFELLLQQWRDGTPHASSQGSGGSTVSAYLRWREQESILRLAHGLWLLDCMLVYHLQRRAVLTIADLSLPLPCHERMWNAQDAHQWEVARQDQSLSTPPPRLLRALEELYIEKRLAKDRGEYARIIMVHGLFQRSWEVERYYSNPLSQWQPVAQRQSGNDVLPKEPIWLPSIPAFAKWQNSACDALDILHWQANATIGQASGLEHPTVLHLHMARIVLLVPYQQIVRLAELMTKPSLARGSQDPVSLVGGLMDSPEAVEIRRWAVSHQYKARLAVIHAGVVTWHIRRYAIDAFYEAPAVALAALTLWAFGVFAKSGATPAHNARERPTSGGPSIANFRSTNGPEPEASKNDTCEIILLDRPTDDELVQQFIKSGNTMQAHISGLGDLYQASTPEKVLVHGCKLLGQSRRCWSVASRWMTLLYQLSHVWREQRKRHTRQ